MKYSIFFLAASVGMLAACSGFEKDIPVEVIDDVEITKVVFNVPPVIDDDAVETKASAIPQSDYNVSFAWEETDRIGIFPNKGSQIYFEPEDGVGTSSASFDGGGWALKSNANYISYYPFVADFDLDRNAIPISFTGQKQKGTEGPFNGERWVLATNSTTSQNGKLTFEYSILNTIINVIATLPAGTYTSASLNIAEPLFVQEGTFSIDNQEITGTTFSKKLEIELENFTLASSETVPIYFMAAPVDLTGKEVKVTVTKDDGTSYSCVKTPSGAYNPGRRRGLTCDQMKKEAEIINFANPEVKRICVANWDTDGDGELDMDEAAAVTDLPSSWGADNAFGGNEQITSFDELQYFKNLTEICDYCFSGCSNLSSIVIPDSVTRIGESAFYNCKLASFNIPDGVTLDAQNGYPIFTSAGASIVIPSCIIYSDDGAVVFGGIFSSVSFTGPITHHSGNLNILFDLSEIASLSFGKNFSYTSDTGGSLGLAIGGLNGLLSVESIVVSPENPDYDSRNDCNAVIRTSTNTLLLGCTNTVIPEDVTAIDDWAFDGNMTTCTIPEQVSQIGGYAFYRCRELTSLMVYSAIPPEISDDYLQFFDSSALTIYVPAGSISAYKTAHGWSYLADRIISMEGGTVPGPGDDGND